MHQTRGRSASFKVIRKMVTSIFPLPRKLNFSVLDAAAAAYDDEMGSMDDLPSDVKDGHFVGSLTQSTKVKWRGFVIELSYLADPGFLKLLEQAAEEYGFKQEGVLAVPSGSGELCRILDSIKGGN